MRNLTKAAIIASTIGLGIIGYNLTKKDETIHPIHPTLEQIEREEVKKTNAQDLESRIAEAIPRVKVEPKKPIERDKTKVDPTRQYLKDLIRDISKYEIDKERALDSEEIEGILNTNYDSSTDLFDLAKVFIESGKLHDAGTTLKLYAHQLGIEDPKRAEELNEIIKNAQNALWGAGQEGEKYASKNTARYNGEGLRDLLQLSHMTALNRGEIEGEEGSRIVSDLTREEQQRYISQQKELTKSVLNPNTHSLKYRDNALPRLVGLFEKPKGEGTEWLSISDQYACESQDEIEKHLSEEKNGKTYANRLVHSTFRDLDRKYKQGKRAFKQYVKHELKEAIDEIGTFGAASSRGLAIPQEDKIKLREVSEQLGGLRNARDYHEQGEFVDNIRRIVYDRPRR